MTEQVLQEEAPLTGGKGKIIFAIMFVGTFIATLSQSMMISALPTIMGEFHIDASMGQLLTTSYIFTLGLIAALTAFLISKINTKYLFMAAMLSFVIGCVSSLFAPNYWLLLASRILQAGGAGISLPLAQVVALHTYPKEEYGRAMGIIGLIIGFAPAIGPAISGIIIDIWSWRAIFIVLGGIVALVCILAHFYFEDMPIHQEEEHIDLLSAFLYIAGAIVFMGGVTAVEHYGFWQPASYIPAFIGALLIALFVRLQLKHTHPLLKINLLKERGFWVSVMLVVLSQIGLMIGAVMVPLFVQDVQGLSPTMSGFIILPGAIILGFANPITGRIRDKFGALPLVLGGIFFLGLGTYAFTLPLEAAPPYVITALYGFRTLGIACLMMPMTAHGCSFLPEEDLAQATALITSFRQIIGSVFTSVLIAIMEYNTHSPIGVDSAGFDMSWSVQTAIILGIGIFALIALPKKKSE